MSDRSMRPLDGKFGNDLIAVCPKELNSRSTPVNFVNLGYHHVYLAVG